jgi:hypothetical protein
MKTRAPALIREAVALVFERLGDTVLCPTCGTTARTMAERCTAELDTECPGFVAYDAARTRALHDVGFFGRRGTSGKTKAS